MEYVSIINSFCSEQGRKSSPRSAPQDEAKDAGVLIDLNLVLRSEMSFTCVMARDSWSRLQSPGIHGSALLSVGSHPAEPMAEIPAHCGMNSALRVAHCASWSRNRRKQERLWKTVVRIGASIILHRTKDF